MPRLARRNQRRQLCEVLRRSWRLQGGRLVDTGIGAEGWGLNLSGIEVGALPELPLGTDLSHIHELNLSGMGLERVPTNFLGCFSRLRRLVIDNNRLQTLPAGLPALAELRELRLRRNNIRMSAPAAVLLGNLRELRILELSYNPLGLISLHFRQLSPLVALRLRRCQLQTVPAGLERCAFLTVADLRDNHLASLPQALLDAPSSLRRVLLLDGNPLPVGIRRALSLPDPAGASPAANRAQWVRAQWLADIDAMDRQRLGELWDRLHAEPDSRGLFELLEQLTEVSDFEYARTDLRRRVAEMLEALESNSELRAEVFNLAGDERTCVDSVASCFSALEVRVLMARALQHAPGEGLTARLNLARRLFRLDRVERFAREDMAAREAAGQRVDEVEVSLAYRTGLALQLDLPGQPRTLQFEAIAGVSQAHLDQAAAAVQSAEASDALAVYVAQRDFWREYLRGENSQRFESVEQQFWERLEALGVQQDSMEEGLYLQRINQLARERQAALDALFLTLTQQALAEQQAGKL